jgi:hypothetical protein
LVDGYPLFIKINGTDSDAATATDFDLKINPFYEDVENEAPTFDLSFGGLINVKTLSIYCAAGGTPYDTLVIRGWEPG